MPTYTNPLEHVKVAAPCPANWERMVGDERARYCDRCSLHVYNLSGMTQREAEALVTSTEGRLCVRFYRRPDGTILTRNCPVGLSALKRRAAHAATATLTAVLGFLAGLGLNFGTERALSPSIMEESAVPAPPLLYPDLFGEHAAPTSRWGAAEDEQVPFMGVMARQPDAETERRVELMRERVRRGR